MYVCMNDTMGKKIDIHCRANTEASNATMHSSVLKILIVQLVKKLM